MADYEVLAPGGHENLINNVTERLDEKAYIDGYYAQLTAGAADSLTGRGDGVSASYLYRTTGGDADVADGTATVKGIHGRTVCWNQLYNSSIYSTVTSNGVTFTVNADGSITANGTASGSTAYIAKSFNAVAEHKYLVKGCPDGGRAGGYRTYIAGQSEIFPGQSYDFGSGTVVTCAASGSAIFVAAAAANGTTVTNLVFRPQLFDLTRMFGAGNEPSTVAEFEALYPESYYPYDAGSLLSVQMEGIETVGFNQWDGTYSSTGHYLNASGYSSTDAEFDITDYIPVVGGQTYYVKGLNGSSIALCWYDAEEQYVGGIRNYDLIRANPVNTFTVPSNAAYVRSSVPKANAATFCINLSWSGYRNGEYEPYWKSERTIPAATYFPNGMRSAGTVYDELTSDAAVTRVGSVDLGTLEWTRSNFGIFVAAPTNMALPATNAGRNDGIVCAAYGIDASSTAINDTMTNGTMKRASGGVYIQDTAYTDAATFKAAMSGVMLHYELATTTTTPIDPPLNLTYRVSDFGTERIMVPANEQSAPPTQQVVYGLNVVDTVRRLPTEYISHDSFTQFRLALGAKLGIFIIETWDENDGRYEYTINDA